MDRSSYCHVSPFSWKRCRWSEYLREEAGRVCGSETHASNTHRASLPQARYIKSHTGWKHSLLRTKRSTVPADALAPGGFIQHLITHTYTYKTTEELNMSSNGQLNGGSRDAPGRRGSAAAACRRTPQFWPSYWTGSHDPETNTRHQHSISTAGEMTEHQILNCHLQLSVF